MKEHVSNYYRYFSIYKFFVGLLFSVAIFSQAQAFAQLQISGIKVVKEGATLDLSLRGAKAGHTYQWTVTGTGGYQVKGTIAHPKFIDSGTFSAKVVDLGTKATVSAKIRVTNAEPTATFTQKFSGVVGSPISFSVKVTDPSSVDTATGFTYHWSFGDGTSPANAGNIAPKHTYAKSGVYTVTVDATDKNGGTSSPASTVVTVTSTTATPIATPLLLPIATPTPTPVPTLVPATTFNPTEISDILSNPGIGMQSNDTVNTKGADVNGIATKVAYVKYYWRNLEVGNQVYDFSSFDANLTKARNAGQKVAFRIVAVDNLVSGPTWLKDLGAKGQNIVYYPDPTSPTVWSPDFNDTFVQQKHFEFLDEIARRYGNSADIDSIDIGSVGLWGEWHYGQVSPAVPEVTLLAKQTIIDKYLQAFPNKPVIAQLSDLDGLKYAVAKGAGFRGDCLGNMSYQMIDLYPNNIKLAASQDAWKKAPVLFETCWDINGWVNRGYDVNAIFDWALANHMSAMNNKNATIPASALPAVQKMLKKAGYRYVVRSLQHAASVINGSALTLSMTWENIGVAPAYGNYVLGVALLDPSGNIASVIVTPNETKNWLPGLFAVDQNIVVPSGLPAGNYTVALALIDPVSKQPKIQLAIAGKNATGWYPMSTVVVK